MTAKRRIELDPKAVGERIRSARVHRNWSRSDLAKAMGVKADTVTMWETGWRIPPRDTIVALAMFLKRSIEWLLLGLPRNGKLWKLADKQELVHPVRTEGDGSSKKGRVSHSFSAPTPGVASNAPGDLLGDVRRSALPAPPHALEGGGMRNSECGMLNGYQRPET